MLLVVSFCSTWSNVSNRCESGWPESVNELSDNKDWGSPASAATNFTDLVPEFEPGKPWKVRKSSMSSMYEYY